MRLKESLLKTQTKETVVFSDHWQQSVLLIMREVGLPSLIK